MKTLAEINKIEEQDAIQDIKEYLKDLQDVCKEYEDKFENSTEDLTNLAELLTDKIKCITHKTNILVYILTNKLCTSRDGYELAEILCEIKGIPLRYKQDMVVFLKEINKISEGRYEHSMEHINDIENECKLFLMAIEHSTN